MTAVPRSWLESRVTIRDPETEGVREDAVLAGSEAWLAAMRRARRLYSDGGVFRPRRCEVGSWAWVATDKDDREVACQYGWIAQGAEASDGITNNMTELLAACRALAEVTAVVPNWSGMLCSDSKVTLGRLSQGWRLKGIPPSWVTRMGEILRSTGAVHYVPMKGHPTRADLADRQGRSRSDGMVYAVSYHQVKCDRLCNEVLERWSAATGITR